MSSTNATTGSSRALGALLLAALPLLSGCDGNVTCVLTNGCRDGGGIGDAGSSARLPEEGQWIVDGPPLVEAVAPDGGFVAGTTPIVVVFNESMNPDTLAGAIELIPFVDGFEGPPVTIPTFALVGEGRALVLLPPVRLTPGEYIVRVADDAELRDITGQLSEEGGGSQLGSFGVDVSDPVDVQVVATYPIDAADDESETGEIVVVFDRAVQDSTVTSDSIQVTIDGSDPTFDSDPESLSFEQGGFSIPDERVYRWRSVDDEGEPDPLPIGGQVLVEVSPAGNEIADSTGAIVQPFVSSYELAPFARPLSSSILSQPMDAIGTANLTPGDPEELMIEIGLMGAEEGDILDLFLFGTSQEVEPRTIAFSRELELTDSSPIDMAIYGLGDIELTTSLNPLEAIFADGPVSFAFRLRRGSVSTALRVLDVDPALDGIQDPVLDTTGPVISEFFFANGGTSSVRSDLRDIIVGGRADEFVRAVEVVSSTFGDNGILSGVIGIDEDGLFIARPIAAGILPPGEIPLDLVTYDAALNPSAPFAVTFQQVGAVGPTGFTPGDPVTVEVFDALTLQPVESALVLTHSDEGNGSDYPFVASGLTDAAGLITGLPTAGGSSVDAIVTVEAEGYDLFTFHGISSARLSLPLTPSGSVASATVEGELTTTDPEAAFLLNLLDRRMGDSRRAEDALPLYPVADCTTDPFGTGGASCPYGPEPVRPGRAGVQTFLAGSFLQDSGTLQIPVLLQGFDLRFPLDVLSPGDASTSEASIPFLLIDNDAPFEERPLELFSPMGANLSLLASGLGGIDLGNLVGDPDTTGDPFITVEAVAPGFPGSFPVGLGLAFEQTAGSYLLRAAYAGAVSEAGFFGLNGLVESDLFLRAELRDSAGNRIGCRPRVSRLDTLPLGNVLLPVGAPVLTSPAAGGNTTAQGFDLVFDETLVDFYGIPGFYRASLEDEGGRRWQVWRIDQSGALADVVRVHVPDLTAGGGTGLLDGTIRASLGVFGVPNIDPGAFLWSDIEREHELFAEAAPVAFQKP